MKNIIKSAFKTITTIGITLTIVARITITIDLADVIRAYAELKHSQIELIQPATNKHKGPVNVSFKSQSSSNPLRH